MPRVCTVCTHPQREAIDRALVAGGPRSTVAQSYGLSERSVGRHEAEHLPAAMVKGEEARQEAHAFDVVKQLRAINGATLQILKESRETRDNDMALKAIDRVQKQIELQAKLLGELNEGTTVNVLVSPEWLQVRTIILQALDPFPDARLALADAMEAHAGD